MSCSLWLWHSVLHHNAILITVAELVMSVSRIHPQSSVVEDPVDLECGEIEQLLAQSERGSAAGPSLIGTVEHIHRATGLLKAVNAEMRETIHAVDHGAGDTPPHELCAALDELRDVVDAADEIVHRQAPGIAAPTSALVTAQLEAGVVDGRRKAEAVALDAGFLGGAGRVAICVTITIGIALCSPVIPVFEEMKHGTFLEASLAFARWYGFHLPIACFLFARAFCLARGFAREAHQITILAFGWAGTFGLAWWMIRLHFLVAWGCSWRTSWKHREGYEEAERLGRQCGVYNATMAAWYAILMIISLVIAVRLYELWRIAVNGWVTLFLFVYSLRELFTFCAKLYIGLGANPGNILAFLLIGCCACMMHYKRKKAEAFAAKLIADDLERYDEQWAKISQAGSHPAVVRLEKAVADEQMHITGVKRGENSRSQDDVLQSVLSRDAMQRIHSLALIFASAHTLNPHFQKKAIGWGAEKFIPVKQAARAVEKMLRSYANDARRLKDLVRNNVTCSTLDEVADKFERIARDESVAIVQIKNGFDPGYDSRKSGGYRDIKLSLVVADAFARSSAVEEHICELQILLKDIHELKFELGGHTRYEKARDALGA